MHMVADLLHFCTLRATQQISVSPFCLDAAERDKLRVIVRCIVTMAPSRLGYLVGPASYGRVAWLVKAPIKQFFKIMCHRDSTLRNNARLVLFTSDKTTMQ
jgi:hypothetical protein